MGFFSSVRGFFSDLFGGDEDPPGGDIPTDEFDDSPSGSHDEFSWQLAGYLQAGETYATGYHNFDPTSPEARTSVEAFHDWDFLPQTDYIVVKVHIGGDSYYTTIAGPFEDYEDLYAAIAEWWEQGS